jgi:hypothetical protein
MDHTPYDDCNVFLCEGYPCQMISAMCGDNTDHGAHWVHVDKMTGEILGNQVEQ